MIYDDLLSGVRTLLDASGYFASVQCGLGKPSAYPAASVWLQKAAAASGKQDPIEDCALLVQIQGYADEDSEQSYLDMMALVAATKQTLHLARLPGRGAQALIVPEVEAMRMEQGGPTVYILRVQARLAVNNFSIT
jgi:hypothetical protein